MGVGKFIFTQNFPQRERSGSQTSTGYSQFRSLKRDCPVCDGARRDCRQNTQNNLIHCRHDVSSIPGWRFVGVDAVSFNMWGVDDGRHSEADWETRRQQQAADRERRLKEDTERFAQSLSADERDRNIRKLYDQLGLKTQDQQELERRGLNSAATKAGKFFSIDPWQEVTGINPRLAGIDLYGRKLLIGQPGFACPIWDVEGRIIGWQTRFDNAVDDKYRWPTSRSKKRPNGATSHLQNGELPITCCRPVEGVERDSIGLAEGFLKPYVAAQKLSQIIVGAAGGNFASSPQQLKSYLNQLSAELNTTTLDLYPDAGAVINKAVMGQYERTIRLVEGWGYTVRVAWWEQISKSDQDVDELPSDREFRYLTSEKFLELAAKEQYHKEVAVAQAKLNNLTYKPDILLNEEYLPSNLWKKLPDTGIVNLKARKGSGKSANVIKPLIAHYKAQGRKVLSITPRIALGREQAFKWNITWIDDCGVAGNYDLTTSLLEQEQALGLCWDSLWKVTGQDWSGAVVIIDESELGFSHLATSSTCADRRGLILVGFAKLLQQVLAADGLVLLADADLTNVSVNYVRALAPSDTPVFTVVNTHTGPAWDIEFYTGKRGDVENRILENLESGLKTAVATDSQNEGEALERRVLEYLPNAKVIRIDRKTTQEDFGREFVKDPNTSIRLLRPDILIYTPSMGIGVSVDEPHFDEVVGMFFGMLSPSEARQMLARIRAPIPRVVWCKEASYDIPGCKSHLPSVVKKQLTKFHEKTALNLLDLAGALASTDDDGAALDMLARLWDKDKEEWNNPHIDLYCNIKARHSFGLSQLAVQLHQELLEEGHNIQDFEGGKTAFSTEIAEAKEEIKQEEAAAIANAEEIDIDRARAILSSPNSKEKDRHKARRAILADSLPGVGLTPKFVYKASIEDRGRWLAQHRLFWMLQNPDLTKILDRKRWHGHLQKPLVYLPDIRTYSLQVEVLRDLGLLDLIDRDREYSAQDEDVKRFHEKAVFMRYKIKTAFDLTVTEKSYPIKLLEGLLQRVGLPLDKPRREGPREQQIRYYKISSDSITDPDRRAVLGALTLKYASLADDFGSQNSPGYITNEPVVVTGFGSQNSPGYITNEPVVVTDEPVVVTTSAPTSQPQEITIGTVVNRFGSGRARYIVESFLSDFVAELTSLATGDRFTAFRSMLSPVAASG